MSDALYNSYRFSSANSARIEGGKGGPPFTTDGRFAFDCSGFVYYVLKNSGYNVSYASAGSGTFTKQGELLPGAAGWQAKNESAAIQAGDLVYFTGHVGFVVNYDPVTQKGVFRSSTGSNNQGKGVVDSEFTTDPNSSIYWGGNRRPFNRRWKANLIMNTKKRESEIQPQGMSTGLDQPRRHFGQALISCLVGGAMSIEPSLAGDGTSNAEDQNERDIQIERASISPDGKVVAFEYGHPGRGRSLGLWEWQTSKVTAIPPPFGGPVRDGFSRLTESGCWQSPWVMAQIVWSAST